MLEVSELTARALDALGIETLQVREPADPPAMARLLSEAGAAGHAVTAWGGGTEQELGSPPERCDLLASTARLRGVLAYAPEDLTISVLAGTTLAEVADALGHHGQFLPIDVPFPDRATVGGVVATAAIPIRRLRYGGLRDLVIGVTVAMPDGTLCSAGGRVVKNVAGYDLCKLFTGSLGTLGIITSLNFKVQPLPHRQAALRGAFADYRQALAAAAALSALGSGYSALIAGQDGSGDPCTLSVVIEGFVSAMEPQRALAREAIAAREGTVSAIPDEDAPALIARLAAWRGASQSTVVRVSVVPARLGTALAAVLAAAGELQHAVQWQADAALGTLFVRVADVDSSIPALARWIVAARRDVQPLGGHLVLARGSLALRRSIDPWAAPPELERLSRSVKAQVDPSRIMNPGRFAYGI